jgi:hypothetical protein
VSLCDDVVVGYLPAFSFASTVAAQLPGSIYTLGVTSFNLWNGSQLFNWIYRFSGVLCSFYQPYQRLKALTKLGGLNICWDAPKNTCFWSIPTYVWPTLICPGFIWYLILILAKYLLTCYFQNFFDCRGNHMRSESVNWWFHFDGSGILSTRHTTRLFTLVNEACIELMVPFTFRRSVTGAALLGL